MLKLQVVLGNDQVLLIGRESALRADYLYRRHGPYLCLSPGVIESLLGVSHRFFLHADVLEGINQIPIHVFDLIDRGDHLQPKGDVRNLAVVFSDADEAGIGQKSKALQQILRVAELKG